MSRNIIIPLSLFERINELVRDLRDSSHEYYLCTKYGGIIRGLDMKLQKLALREAHARVLSAQDESDRLRARAEFQRLRKLQAISEGMDDTCALLKAYEDKIGHITGMERTELRKWVDDGNSPYANPCLIYGENGRILDFITAIRLDEDMRRNPEDYFPHSDLEQYGDPEFDELPF